jgi:cellulose synthase/poly-beta-1,6-N-acetylglucosamine synthase-like glycosyltransferase/transposase
MKSKNRYTEHFKKEVLSATGLTVSDLCKKYGIDRSTYYQWKNQQSNVVKKPKTGLEREVISIIKKNPSLSLNDIFHQLLSRKKRSVRSRAWVQKTLRKNNLTTSEKRSIYVSSLKSYGKNLLKENEILPKLTSLNKNKKFTITPALRSKFLSLVKDGYSISSVCTCLNINRSTYYTWSKRVTSSNQVEVNRAGRKGSLDQRVVQIVLDITKLNPNWSVDKIHSYIHENTPTQLISRAAIQKILQKNNLSTAFKRLQNASKSISRIESPVQQVQDQVMHLSTDKQVIHSRGDPSPPSISIPAQTFTSSSNQSKPFNLTKLIQKYTYNNIQLIFATIIVALINAYLTSHIVNTIIQAETIIQKIGIALSSVALFCGIFFFLYSLKYYITIFAVILNARTKRSHSDTTNSNTSLFSKVNRLIQKASPNVIAEADPTKLHNLVTKTELEKYPFFSVQVALYNEKRVAERVVRAALAMEYPNFEIVVCDDSTDETTAILQEKFGNDPRVKLVHRTNRTGFKGAALGNGLNHMDSRTDYVVVFDADFVPYPDTLTLFAKYYQVISKLESESNKSIALLGESASQVANHDSDVINNLLPNQRQAAEFIGKTIAIQGYQWHVLNKSENWITRAVRAEFAGSYIIERSGGQLFGLLKQIAGSVYSINATVLKEVGWGTSITEDFQLTLKLYERGYKVGYTPYIQAPSECVSTLKRLIRQRQRWAEGHSFNIKKHLNNLLTSENMTLKEKWEAIYLTPYYLQALFFVTGTLCWIIAESILNVKLPFWTAALGWSLVLTNLFSLPLMNTIGLFMEEGEERDYLGIFSFVTLCYILAPFIGFAALKGFIEKEEGPWFRTPKSGHITDNVKRVAGDRKRDKLIQNIPWIKPILGALNIIASPNSGVSSPYLAYTTAGNSFNNGLSLQRINKFKKRVMHTIVLLLMTTTVLANVLQSSIPQVFANPDTYYVRDTLADNITDSSTDKRTLGSTEIGSGGAGGTVTFEELETGIETSTNPTSITTSASLTGVNDQLYLAVVSTKPNDAVSSVTGLGLTWTLVKAQCGARGQTRTEVWKALGTVSGDGTVTANFSTTPISAVLAVHRYSGVDTSSPTGTPAGKNSIGVNDTTCTGGVDAPGWTVDITTTANNALAFGAVGIRQRTNTPGTGYTERADVNSGTGSNDAGVATEEKTVTSPSTVAVDGTASNDVDYSVVAFEIKPGAGSSTQIVNSTNTTFYMLTDNLNKRWTSDTKINDSNTTGDRRNVSIATESDGDTIAVWEDSRNTDSSQNIFATTRGGLVRGRYAYGANPLLDGRAILTGGYSDTTGSFESTAEIYDPVANTFSLLGTNLATMRYSPQSVVLNDGRVLIAGGRSATNTVVSSSDIFDPNTNTMSAGPNMTTNRTNFQMVKLANGKVLAIAGCTTFASGSCSASTSTSELFDPGTGTWTATGSMSTSGQSPRAINLPNGEVLAISNGSVVERYNPVTGTWRKTGAMNETRSLVTLASSSEDKVLATGGFSSNYTSTAEIYDSTSETWTTINPMGSSLNGQGPETPFVTLGNGKILLAGYDNGGGASTLSAALLFDPVTETHTAIGSMTSKRTYIKQIVLANGKVLIAGGWNGTASSTTADVYSPVTYDIYAQKYDKTGAKLWSSGTDIRVNTDDGNRVSSSGPPNYNHLNPSVSLDGSGNAIVAWEEQRDGISSSSVWSQKLQASDGSKLWPTGTDNQWANAKGTTIRRRGASVEYGGRATALNNGKVLITGTDFANVGISQSELYDPAAGTFAAGSNSIRLRNGHSATPLLNGKVLIAGGSNNLVTASTAELYDPITNTFTLTTGPLTLAGGRQMHTATLMKNGKVLLTGGGSAGGGGTTSTEIFDPNTGTFSAGAGMNHSRTLHDAVTLPNGKVLVVGADAGTGTTAAEIFDPFANSWSLIPANTARGYNSLLLLNNGKVLSTGNGTSVTSNAELYDPALNTWTSAGTMLDSISATNMILLPNGKVLTGGGFDESGGGSSQLSEIYDPTTNTWTATSNNLTQARLQAQFVYLPLQNKAFVIQGPDTAANSTAELYTPVADMPVSQYNYNNQEAYKQTNTGSINNLFLKKPKVVVDDNGDAVIAWQDNRDALQDFQGVSYGYVNTAYTMFGDKSVVNRCTYSAGCGAQPNISSPPIKIMSQKICNSASCGDAGTTSGEKQWGNDIANTNKNSPHDRTLSSTNNAQNISIVNDGTNVVAVYDSDSGTVNQSSKTGKVYSQKLNSSGVTQWSTPWTNSTGNLSTTRYGHTATLLGDGKILVAGGENANMDGLSTAEVYDPQTQTSSATSNNITAQKFGHTSTLLNDGRVLVAGGGSSAITGSSSANLYNPSTNTFAATSGNMIGNRIGHTATLLPNGRVLIAGGKNGTVTTYLSSAETFNPVTGTFTAITGNINTAKANHAAALLPDGKVLIAGGATNTATPAVTTASKYDPAAGTATSVAAMAIARSNFTLTPLQNGKILAVGGYNASNVRLSSAEVYDPNSNVWSTTGSLTSGIRSDHAATVLPNGQVLITGGSDGTNNFSTAELFDPLTGTFTATTNLNTARAYHTQTILPDGRIVILGGSTASDVITTTSARTAGTASAGTNWTTTSGTLQAAFSSSNDIYAIYNNAGQNNEFLTNFGFTVPSASNITGLTASVEGNGTSATAAQRQFRIGTTKDASTLAGTEKAANQLNQTTDTTLTIPATGATIDPWGNNTLTPSEVNATNFGFRVRDQDTTAAALNFDQLTLAVTYVANSGITSTAELFSIDQKISTADSTESRNPDLIKDTVGNFQIIWQAWRSEGLSPGASGGSWKILSQEIDNASATVTKQYPTGSTNTWSSAATLPAERAYASQVVLPSGKVLLIAGNNQSAAQTTSHLYDPQANTWTATGNIQATYGYGTRAVVLSNGKALTVGAGGSLNQSHIYDPATGTWTASGNLVAGRGVFEMVTLNNGKVLAAGGTDYTNMRSSSELYDPTTGTWSSVGNMSIGRKDFGLVKLNDGKVLAMGGCSTYATCGSNNLTSAEIFDPNTNTWSTVAGMGTTRRSFQSHLLSNGKVMVYGGYNSSALSTSEVFDPNNPGWTALATAPGTAFVDTLPNSSVVLPNGKVMAIRDPGAGAQSFIYDPYANTWSTGASLTTARNASLILLKTGKVLAAGGYNSGGNFLSSSELYTPNLSEQLVSSDDTPRNYHQTEPKIASDSANGYSYVAWNDNRLTAPSDTTIDKNIYTQKLDGNGSPVWPNGLGESGTYDVRDVRINNTRGSLDTTIQTKVSLAKTVFTNSASDKPLQFAWLDSRDTTPSLSVYGQSYNVMNYSMSSTTWTSTFYVNAVSSGNQMNIQVGAMEADGENAYFLSTTGTFSGDNVSGAHTMNFNTLPPTGEASLTHKRLIMKFTHNAGSGITISYNGTAGVADTKLDVGTIVPERSALLGFLIPFLPAIVYGYKKRKRITKVINNQLSTQKK